VPFIDAI